MRNLVIAMVVSWVIHLVYLITLAVRQHKLRQETEELRQTLQRLERASSMNITLS